MTRPPRGGKEPSDSQGDATDVGEESLELEHPCAEAVFGGCHKGVVDGGRVRAFIKRIVRFPRGDGGGVGAPSPCQAVDSGFQAGMGVVGFVDLVAYVVEWSGDYFHDSRDLLAGFDTELLAKLGDVGIADHGEVTNKGVVGRLEFASYLLDEFAT